MMVPSARFERAAFSSAGRRSNPLSYEGPLAGRQGFEPWVEFNTPQPLSRRSRSATPAPPRAPFSIVNLRLPELCSKIGNPESQVVGGGRGIRTLGDPEATTVFKTVAIVHSAIPPRRGGRTSLSGATISV